MISLDIGIFGATGGVGREILNVLYNLEFPVGRLSLFAGKSAGTVMQTQYGGIEVMKADEADYTYLDVAFWSINAEWANKNLERTRGSMCYVIDNSSAFRYRPEVPLVVPEVNGDQMRDYDSKLIANPNCTTAIAAIPLHKLNRLAGIEKIIFTTYQSASGAGDGGREELLEQTRNYLDGSPVLNEKFQHPLPFNVIPHIDRFMENGYTREEMKTDWETRKILGLDDSVRISSTCVRVPVLRCHALDITVKTRGPVDLDEYKSILKNEPMLELKDDLENLDYPMPINTTGKYPVAVGRLRHPVVFENGVRMFVSGDQLLRGAALNAVLIVKKIYDYLSWP